MLNIGETLKEQRESRNLSQSQLADKIGISQQNISRWESNSNIPNIIDCIKLADFYGISFDTLIGREDYATGNIEIKGEILSDKERQLIQFFRSLDNSQQETILPFLNAAIPQSSRKKHTK